MVDLLQETGKTECKPIATPMDANQKLRDAKEEPKIDR